MVQSPWTFDPGTGTCCAFWVASMRCCKRRPATSPVWRAARKKKAEPPSRRATGNREIRWNWGLGAQKLDNWRSIFEISRDLHIFFQDMEMEMWRMFDEHGLKERSVVIFFGGSTSSAKQLHILRPRLLHQDAKWWRRLWKKSVQGAGGTAIGWVKHGQTPRTSKLYQS